MMNNWKLVCHILLVCMCCCPCSSMRCYECHDVPSPRLCDTITTCGSQEVCSVQQYVTSGGLILYKTGCSSVQKCSTTTLIGRRDMLLAEISNTIFQNKYNRENDVAFHTPSNMSNGRRKRDDIITCQSCCNSSFCNNQGCGEQELPKDQRGPYCFNCGAVTDPVQCNHVATCSKSQVCMIKPNDAFHGQTDHVYTLSCSSQSCTSSTSTFCQPSCCSGDYCNINVTCSATHNPLVPSIPSIVTSANALTTAVRNSVVELLCRKHILNGFSYDYVTETCMQVNKLAKAIDYFEAEISCRVQNASLIMIETQYIQDKILSWIFTHHENDTDFWIGAKTPSSDPGNFFWPNGQHVTFNHWDSLKAGQPDTIRLREKCVYLNNRDKYYWHDDSCLSPKTGFICEIWNVAANQKESVCNSKSFYGYSYDAFTDTCFSLHYDDSRQQFTQLQAKQICQHDAASLATIDSEQKMDIVLQSIFVNRQNSTDFWIGAEDVNSRNIYRWPTGQDMSWTHWGVSSYKKGQRRCVYIDSQNEYTWNDKSCDDQLQGYICQQFIQLSGEVPLSRCKSLIGNEHYIYDQRTQICISARGGQNVSRIQARKQCQAEQADLVVIDDHLKMDFIARLLTFSNDRTTGYWIGGYDEDNSRNFVWEPTHQKFNYTNWRGGKVPSALDCAFLNHKINYFWSYESCSISKLGYICQISHETINTS